MRIRSTPRVFPVINDLKYKNLVVGGCSFTYNISDTDSSSWPYYLRDKCDFEQVYDCSIEGASNYQIFSSVVYALETNDLDPKETLVIIMWSGYGRDGEIVSTDRLVDKKYAYAYDDQTSCIMLPQNKHKNEKSQALENYIYLTSVWHYLKNQNYQFVFLNFVDPTLRTNYTFNIELFLPADLKKKFKSMFTDIENFFVYCVKHNQLQEENLHPTMQGHLDWTHYVLAPALAVNPYAI